MNRKAQEKGKKNNIKSCRGSCRVNFSKHIDIDIDIEINIDIDIDKDMRVD